ncbi:hypothetical protein N2152v2_006732 [Parachlorella kessleri]
MLRSLAGLLLAVELLCHWVILPLEAHQLQATRANDSHSLLEALRDPRIGSVILAGDIVFQREDYTLADLVTIDAGHHVVITTEGAPNFTDPLGPVYTGSVTVNFSQLWPVITVGGGASLQLENLVMVGLVAPTCPDVAGITRVRAMVGWPTINADPGAEIVYNNTLLRLPATDCSPSLIQQRMAHLTGYLGAAGVNTTPTDPPLIVAQGTQALPLPVVPFLTNEPSLGDVRVVNRGLAVGCEQVSDCCGATDDRWAPSRRYGHGEGAGASAWWIWLIVGVAGACALATVVVAVWMVSRRARAMPRLVPPSGMDSKAASDSCDDKDVEAPSQASEPSPGSSGVESSQYQAASMDLLSYQPGVSHALRIRFGDLDESVELGELIGKGGYGRVYKARWKGSAAAIKVLEHSMASTPGAGASGSSQALTTSAPVETILAAALSHPNLVATYKVSSVRLREASSNASLSSGGPGEPTAAGAGLQAQLLPGPAGGSPPPVGPQERAATLGAAGLSANSGASLGGGGSMCIVALEEGLSSKGPPSPSTPMTLEDDRRHRQPVALFETWMVLEYCDKGSLADAIAKRKFRGRQTGQPAMHAILLCLQDIARGMEYLHSNNVIHGDLKPGKLTNVLLKSREDGTISFTCKIADLGLSRLLDPQQSQRLTRSCGTVGYMPPEMLTAGRLTTACDVYSFGILMWELATCQFAFTHLPAAQVVYRVVQLGERLGLPQGLRVPVGYLSLMQRCWAAAPGHRPSFSQISTEVAAMLADS